MRSQRLTFVRSGEKRAFCLAALAEPMVKAVSRFFAAVMLSVALTLSASSVLAQINPFRGNRAEPALTGTDLDLLGASVARLNQNPKVAVGSKEEWTNPATGSHGTSIVTRVFTSSQRPCHTLHHEFFPFDQNIPQFQPHVVPSHRRQLENQELTHLIHRMAGIRNGHGITAWNRSEIGC